MGAPSNIGNGLSRLVETIPGQSSPISTSYEYDKDNRPIRVTMNNKSYMTNSYDALGRLTEKKITDGIKKLQHHIYILSWNKMLIRLQQRLAP